MYRFRHALLREVVHDDLLPGEHAELHLALARALERRAAAGRRGRVDHAPAWRTTSARRATSRPRCGASVQAAAAVGARPRPRRGRRRCWSARWRSGSACPTPRRSRAPRTPICWCAPPPRTAPTSTTTAAPSCCALAVAELERRDGDPHAARRGARRAGERPVVARPRRGEPRHAAARARAAPGRRAAAPSAPSCSSRRVAFLMLQGRYGEVRDEAHEALEAARAVGADQICAPILNRLGVALFALGDPEERRGRVRRGAARRARHRPGDRRGVRGCQPRRRAAPRRPQPRGPGRRRSRPSRRPGRLARRALAGDAAGGDRVRPRGVGRRRGAPAAPRPPHRYDARQLRTSPAPACCSAAATRARRGRCWRRPRGSSRSRSSPSSSRAAARCAGRARAPRGQPRRRARGRRGGDRPDRVLQRGRRAARRGRLRRRRASRPTPPSAPATSATRRPSAARGCARR